MWLVKKSTQGSAAVAGPAEGPSAVEPRRHRVQLGPAPTTTDLRWPAGLQAPVDLQCLSPHRSHIRTLPPTSHERLASILVSDSREIGKTEVHKHNPRPTLQESNPDGCWPVLRPWAIRGAIRVPTQPGAFLPVPVHTHLHFAYSTPESSSRQSQ